MSELITYTADEQMARKKYKASAEATAAEKDIVGGEKGMNIKNILFQSDSGAQAIATKLKNRLKNQKNYCAIKTGFCPVPIEIGDIIRGQERITGIPGGGSFYGAAIYGEEVYADNGIVLAHEGAVRKIKLSISPQNQSQIMTIEQES